MYIVKEKIYDLILYTKQERLTVITCNHMQHSTYVKVLNLLNFSAEIKF